MNEILTTRIPRSIWHGWGDPSQAHPLSEAAWEQLEAELGIKKSPNPLRPVPLEEVELPQERLLPTDVESLAKMVGAENIRTDRLTRIEHAGGKSYPDMYRVRQGDASGAPDAVVLPADEEEIAQLLDYCSAEKIVVVPFGGGTSVVGGLDARPGKYRASIAIDLRRLNKLISVDKESRTAVMEPGLRGPEIELALRPYGFTMGHYPQSHQEATLGGYVATRSAGQASTGYGRSDELVEGARIITPSGKIDVGNRAPASAAGPDLKQLIIGSEGTLGIITELNMRVAPLPSVKRYASVMFPTWADGAAALRELAQMGQGVIPEVCRLSDGEETRVALMFQGKAGDLLTRYAKMRKLGEPSLGIFLWEGQDKSVLSWRRKHALSVMRKHGGVILPGMIAKKWEEGRFSSPYLRDELMGHGVLVETLETATHWENVPTLYREVGKAIESAFSDFGSPCLVQCHISHVYASGASLYYTFVGPEGADAVSLWAAIKSAASDAIIENGGTVTHHHAVGRDHQAWYKREIGDAGFDLLHKVKNTLDPAGILNPGVLFPRSENP